LQQNCFTIHFSANLQLNCLTEAVGVHKSTVVLSTRTCSNQQPLSSIHIIAVAVILYTTLHELLHTSCTCRADACMYALS
jgi:hypothetical protein